MNNQSHTPDYRIRMAQLADIPAILALFADEVKAGRMLPRSEDNLRAGIMDWRVAESENEIVGCVSLVFFNPQLCEVRSLAVSPRYRNNGLGKSLITAAMALAEEREAQDVIALTRAPWLFEYLGFERSDIGNFNQKVQQDCQACPFIDNCDEITLHYQIEEKVLA